MRFARTLWLSSNHWLAWFHRWAGVVLCVLFFIWFASGMVLHFVGFPSLSDQDRARFAEEIDLSQLRIEPSAAVAEVSDAQDLRLISVAGHPQYVIVSATKGLVAIAGDSGERSPPLSSDTARVVAEKFGRHKVTAVDGPFDFDQWVVHQQFDLQRPLFRVRMDDDQHTDLYVSARTGEVVQQTHRRERMWNWCGAVIHWIYFTPLRHSWSAWDRTMWSISLVALVTSVAGVWLGFVRLAANRSAGRKGLSPFRGWMRWHHVIGLFASIIVVTWILSGWLSMDHGRLFSRGEPSAVQISSLRGMSIEQMAQAAPLPVLHSLKPASEIGFNAIAGQAFVTTHGSSAVSTRIVSLASPSTPWVESIPVPLLLEGLNNLWPGRVAPLSNSDTYDQLYRRAESTSAHAAAFVVAGRSELRVYVDRQTGRLLAVMDPSRRAYAWIYYALHTLQFPGLIERPTLRTIIVLVLLGVGLIFSATGAVLGVKRLQRSIN